MFFEIVRTLKAMPFLFFDIGTECIQGLRGHFEKRLHSRRRAIAGLPRFPSVEEVLESPCFFVLSTGRCGTLLITKILAKSSRLRVEHNPKPELEYASKVVHRDSLSVQAQEIAVLASRFDLFFLDTLLRGKIYVETNNRISLFAHGLANLLPNSKFIHIVRDPADFVRSGMRRGYYQEGVTQHQRLDGTSYSPWSSFSRLEKIAWEWNEINGKIEDFKCNVDPSRVITVNSERLYSDPGVTDEIFNFLNICNPYVGLKGARSLARLLSRPINKQNKSAFPKYREWSNSHKDSFHRIVTLAPRYGYSYK